MGNKGVDFWKVHVERSSFLEKAGTSNPALYHSILKEFQLISRLAPWLEQSEVMGFDSPSKIDAEWN